MKCQTHLATQALVPHTPTGSELSGIPREVQRLYPREREIASIVYEKGLASAVDVEAALDNAISNPAVRSMLNRLVRKGILTRIECGKFGSFIYGPALTQLSAREIELRHFADDFYNGSLNELAAALLQKFGGQPAQRKSGSKAKARGHPDTAETGLTAAAA